MTLFVAAVLAVLGWMVAAFLTVVVLVTARVLAGRVDAQRTQARVAQAEVQFYAEHIDKFFGNSLPRMGLPYTHVDADGDQIRIDYAPDSDEAIVVSTQWGNGLCVSSAALETWDVRKAVAAAVLAGVPRSRVDQATQDTQRV